MSVQLEDIGWAIRQQIILEAEQERVFKTITLPEEIVKWDYYDHVQTDLRENGRITLVIDGVTRTGRIARYSPPRIFEFRITLPYPSRDRHRTYNAVIQFTVDDVNGSTQLKLRHRGFPRRDMAELEERAWRNIYLPRLKDYVEKEAGK